MVLKSENANFKKVSTTALDQQLHTAHFANDKHRDISIALSDYIDKNVEAKDVLKVVVLVRRQDITYIKARKVEILDIAKP